MTPTVTAGVTLATKGVANRAWRSVVLLKTAFRVCTFTRRHGPVTSAPGCREESSPHILTNSL
jgi:hypothetical protein